ncbi:hypothetical protein FOA52_002521 [Chlamydomonas sp. UWO 241]|nr:hypothetical protein FOA52_002521 [Chlamydomonas sp. UWO 241]
MVVLRPQPHQRWLRADCNFYEAEMVKVDPDDRRAVAEPWLVVKNGFQPEDVDNPVAWVRGIQSSAGPSAPRQPNRLQFAIVAPISGAQT